MQSLGLLLNDAARLLRSEFERNARRHRLTLLQWKALAHLSREDGLSQTALCGRIDVSAMTMSDIAEKLEANGLATRGADPADSRAKLIWIAPPGVAIVDEMRAIAVNLYDRALDGVSEADRAALTRALDRIVFNLSDGQQAEQDTAA